MEFLFKVIQAINKQPQEKFEYNFDVYWKKECTPLITENLATLTEGIEEAFEIKPPFILMLKDGQKQYQIKTNANFKSLMKRKDPSVTHEITVELKNEMTKLGSS